MAEKKTYVIVRDANPDTLVIHCGDARMQGAFAEFISQELSLSMGQYVLFVPRGGGGQLLNPMTLPKEFKSMKDTIEFYCGHFRGIKRIVVINHEDCGYYKALAEKVAGVAAGAHIDPHKSLPVIGKIITDLLGHLGMKLELYFAKFADTERTKVFFEKVQ